MQLGSRSGSVALLFCLSCVPSARWVHAQTTSVTTEYLMTIDAPLDPGKAVDSALTVYNVRPGGWVKGPKIQGTVEFPSGDWLRVMPSGVARLDVRGLIRTDDGALIYISYNGIISRTKQTAERDKKGEVLTSKDEYFVIAPTMETSSPKYAWLNGVQCIGKMVELKPNVYVKYDIFVVR